MDPYEILQIQRNATDEEITKAYRRMSLKYHPDKGGTADEFIKINMAYQILQQEQQKPSREFYELFMDILKRMMAAYKPPHPHHHALTLKIDVTLKELYIGAIKKISVKVLKDNVPTSRNIYLSLLNYQTSYIYTGLGDNGGDIIVKLNIIDDDYIRLDRYVCKNDLYIEKSASLYDLIYGFEDDVDLFGVETIKVIHSPDAPQPIQKLVKIVKNKGLPASAATSDRGDVYIYYDLSLQGVNFDNVQVKNAVEKHFSLV
jgi:DnaJ-class molecular chaperone